jgi:hypothetical protein
MDDDDFKQVQRQERWDYIIGTLAWGTLIVSIVFLFGSE